MTTPISPTVKHSRATVLNQPLKQHGGAGSGNFGHAGRPGLVGGSAPDGVSSPVSKEFDEIDFTADKNATPSPKGKHASFSSEKGGMLFHGTTQEIPEERSYYIHPDSDGVVYLTDDFDEASGYARGLHLGGSGKGRMRVIEIGMTPGKVANVQDAIDDAVANGDDFTDIFNSARKQGFDYVFYLHPAFYSDGEQRVIVALNPDATLGSVDSLNTNFIKKNHA